MQAYGDSADSSQSKNSTGSVKQFSPQDLLKMLKRECPLLWEHFGPTEPQVLYSWSTTQQQSKKGKQTNASK